MRRVIVMIIGILIVPLAVCGILMWGISDKGPLVALSTVFVFVGAALFIGALAWPTKRKR